jgi:hypothetical protein
MVIMTASPGDSWTYTFKIGGTERFSSCDCQNSALSEIPVFDSWLPIPPKSASGFYQPRPPLYKDDDYS